MKRIYALPLLALISACSKDSTPDPAPNPPTDAHTAWVEYAMLGLESVAPVASLDLSATSGLDWQQAMQTPDPYAKGTTSKTLTYKDAQTLVVTLTVPTKPATVNKDTFLGAQLVVDGKVQGEVIMDKTFLANPGNYKSGVGATMTLTVNTKDIK
ncbi:hypothetical protein [Hymenobacter lucidus]|uniref:Lipid/polyisoprenoid-binding YceI-like domain-containing protein n=1 Tax=Hymenobacter lucidus TaxID=2880930 RepID=A0ABS8AYA1_9BACT|nr:hypothetical protein [Hymenobacter lucidus]MCB2410795.1 hypothetical protein [Hymenobacter lucidus]